MASSKNNSAEGSRKYRMKKRNDPLFREKERLRKREYRKRIKVNETEEEKNVRRLCDRERKRRQRAKNKIEKKTTGSPYSRPDTLSKAVYRASLKLPKCPRKRKEVVRELARREGLIVKDSPNSKKMEKV